MTELTRKEIRELLNLSETTVRTLLQNCGFDMNLSKFPREEVEDILIPARKLMDEEKYGLSEVKEWATKRRVELYGNASNVSTDDEMASLLKRELLDATKVLVAEAVRENMEKIPDLFRAEFVKEMEEGELHGAFLVWQEKRQRVFKEELQNIPRRPTIGLPFISDEAIDTKAETMKDDP